jgi:predicted metal-binding protein
MNINQTKGASAASGRLRWTRRAGPLAAAVVAIGLLAGCGGSSGATTQGGSASSKQQDSAQVVRYSQCMRAHGVTNFPDPTSRGALTLDKTTIESPQYRLASQACRSLAPAGSQSGSVNPQVEAQALRFAQCMRSHGVSNFPDPSTSSPGGPVGFAISQSVHDSPALRSAAHACRSLFGGGARIGGYGS